MPTAAAATNSINVVRLMSQLEMLNGSSVNRAELMELIGKSIVGISDPVRQMFLSGKSNFLQQQIAHEQVVTNTTVQNPTLHAAMSDTATQLPVQNAVTPVQQPTHTLDFKRTSKYLQPGRFRRREQPSPVLRYGSCKRPTDP